MKLRLTILGGSLLGRVYELSEGFLTIGRSANCTVQFDPLNERIASKQHAYIEKKTDGFYLFDNKSANGTFLNGSKIQVGKLNSGDRIQFGENGIEATIELENETFSSEEQTQIKQVLPTSPLSQMPTAQYEIDAPQAIWQNSISGLSQKPSEIASENVEQKNYVLIAGVIFGVVFFSLVVVLMMITSLGIVPAVIASVIAFTPAMFYILPLIWLDRYDPEPTWLLALAFGWGAIVAVIVSAEINSLLGAIFGDAFGAVVSAPIFEEGSKGIGLLILLSFFRKYFDDILDGIVFAGVIALGFATVENVLYYGRGINAGRDELIALLVMRGIASPFAHVTFTAMTGIGFGIARETHNKTYRILFPLLGYFAAVALHAFWNGIAVFFGGEVMLWTYGVLEFPFFCILIGFAFYTMYRQNKIIKEMLAFDVVRGLISQEQLKITTSAFRSTFWIFQSILIGKFKARTKFLRAVGKLGLSYWHIKRASEAQGQTASFQQNPILRDEVLKWRDKV